MNIPSIIRRGVKTIERAAGSVRVQVFHYPVIGRDEHGPILDDEPFDHRAFMEWVAEGVTLQDGTETTSKAKLTFFEPIAVKDRDVFEVPDGYGGWIKVNVQTVKGPMDTTRVPYFAEVLLGEVGNR
jgi:hypothetical protein